MTYLILLILSLYIFDPFKRLNGGLYGFVRRLRGKSPVVAEIMSFKKGRVHRKPVTAKQFFKDPSTYTKPEESLLSKTKLYHESIDQKPFNEGDIL